MSFLWLPNDDISVKEVVQIAGLKGKLHTRADTLEACGHVHVILSFKDKRGKEAIVSTNCETKGVEILVVEPDKEEEDVQDV